MKTLPYNYAKADAVNTIFASWEDVFTPSTKATDKCTVTECKVFKGSCKEKDPVTLVKPKWEVTLK
jgi:hypothetical protein